MSDKIIPKIITVLREGYSYKAFSADLISGVVVGIVALPLAIAFAIASGVKPEQGLYTAIVAGLIISLLGGSRVQISGPTGAFIVVVYAIVQKHGYEGLAVATFMAGLMLMMMGFLRMGVLLRFIPYPVVVGFTSGIALIIFSSQIADFFGLAVTKVPAEFIEKWVVYGEHAGSVHTTTVMIAIVSLLIVFLFPKITPKIPGSLVAIIVMTPLVSYFDLPVATIESRFGPVPNSLPTPQALSFSLESVRALFPAAMTIAFLGAIESLLSAVVADGMLGTRHRSNMELVAQGLGNVVSPIFMGIPATGAIARTAVNVKNGGRSPVAGIVHALTLLCVMLVFGNYAGKIPIPVLAAILVYVAYNMSEWRTFVRMLRAPKSDVAVLLATFSLTVLIDLTVAIEVGVVLAAFLFLKRMESVTEIGNITHNVYDDDEGEDPNPIAKKEIPSGVEVFELFGPFFYGVVERFKNAMHRVERPPRVLIVRMRNVPSMDASALNALEDAYHKCKRDGTTLILSSLRPQPLQALKGSGLYDLLGSENVLPTVDSAIRRASELLPHHQVGTR